MHLVDLIVKMGAAKDKSVARRLMMQGMVSFNGRKYTNIEKEVFPREDDILKIGSSVVINLRKEDIEIHEIPQQED